MIVVDVLLKDFELGFNRYYDLHESIVEKYNRELFLIEAELSKKHQEELEKFYAYQEKLKNDSEVAFQKAMKAWEVKRKTNLIIAISIFGFLLIAFLVFLGFVFFVGIASDGFLPALIYMIGFLPLFLFILFIVWIMCVGGGILFNIIFVDPKKPTYNFKAGLPPEPQSTTYIDSNMIYKRWLSKIDHLRVFHETDGTYGEKEFVETIRTAREILIENSREYFAFFDFPINKHLDIDLLVISPEGLWVFEIKYWKGKIIYDSGKWSQVIETLSDRNNVINQARSNDFPLEQQWQSEVTGLIDLLSNNLKVEKEVLGKQVRGGLVFNHPQAFLEIDKSCPVKWGASDFWMEELRKADRIPEWTTEKSMQILDILTNHYAEMENIQARKSVIGLAEEFFRDIEATLQERIT